MKPMTRDKGPVCPECKENDRVVENDGGFLDGDWDCQRCCVVFSVGKKSRAFVRAQEVSER